MKTPRLLNAAISHPPLGNYYKPSRRRGAAVVEFAIVAPVMILFMFGLIEVGRMLMVKNALTHASREGARIAVTPAATIQQIEERVGSTLAGYFDAPPTISVIPANLAVAAPGDMVRVRVEVDVASVSWIPGAIELPISVLSGETTMRRESTN